MKQHQEIWLKGFTRVSDAGMPHLSGLVGLRTLRLRNTMVTDRGLEHLVGRQKLKELSLRKSKVTDAGMVLVAQLPELTSLNLDFTSVTDAGARHLESLKKLRETQHQPWPPPRGRQGAPEGGHPWSGHHDRGLSLDLALRTGASPKVGRISSTGENSR